LNVILNVPPMMAATGVRATIAIADDRVSIKMDARHARDPEARQTRGSRHFGPYILGNDKQYINSFQSIHAGQFRTAISIYWIIPNP
jgi:hypothetical protein